MRFVDPVKARFAARPESVAAARVLVTDFLVDAGRPELLDDARLLVSELATNAVLHARTDFSVSLRLSARRLHVEVEDGARELPEPQALERVGPVTLVPSPEHGRGLRLIGAAADTWGCRVVDDGKVVWFDLER